MSKYKSLDEPITRREACSIIDGKRFDALVRSGELVPIGKRGELGGVVPVDEAGRTSPLLFDQGAVRRYAEAASTALSADARDYREESKAIARRKEPMTKRQIAATIGKHMTGVLIRSGVLTATGRLTDTQTAAHTYDPVDVAKALSDLADHRAAEARLLSRSSRSKVPA